jgi:predicted nucleotidyltransferase
MHGTSLDFSQRRDLAPQSAVIAAVNAVCAELATQAIIVGAFARDLQLRYRHGIPIGRETTDLDLALAVSEWQTYERIRQALIESGDFRTTFGKAQHELRHKNDLLVDLVPFGQIETRDRQINWPPSGEFRMDVFGFEEAQTAAEAVLLPNDVHARVVSLAAIALLKVICWQDRHTRKPQKDAHDLNVITRNYLRAGNAERLYHDYTDWFEAPHFDYETAGARLLGVDIAALLDNQGVDKVAGILAEQSAPEVPGRLPNEMDPHNPDRAIVLLEAMLHGLFEYV